MSGCNKKKNVFFCLKIFFPLTNSVGSDEMLHYVAFHLGPHCLLKYPFRDFPRLAPVLIASLIQAG